MKQSKLLSGVIVRKRTKEEEGDDLKGDDAKKSKTASASTSKPEAAVQPSQNGLGALAGLADYSDSEEET